MFGQYPLSSEAPFAELSLSDQCGYILNWIVNFVLLAGLFIFGFSALAFLLLAFL